MKNKFLLCLLLAVIACNMSAFAQEIKTPKQAIKALVKGNERFMKDHSIHPHEGMQRVKSLIGSQKPFAAVVACSDSRVPVELLFDCGFGDIFVIRTAGNTVIDDSTLGSVDYAINHLGVQVVVVLGHTHCGAITAVTELGKAHDEHDGHHHISAEDDKYVTKLITRISEDIPDYVGKTECLDEAIAANTKVQLDILLSVPHIAKSIEEGELAVVSANYDIETGLVTFDK
ncbi:MAG: carbonic anhydrase [Rikenellaceae bacterium]